MENLTNIETYIKILVAIIGGFVAFGKLRESFASIKRKQELKLDLEILEKLKVNKEFDTKDIEEKIELKLKQAFENQTENFTNFFVGIAVFIGFGWWSVEILNNYENFNGWIILTIFCSLIGLSLIFDNDDKSFEKKSFYKIGFYDKDNFKIGIIITLLFGALTPILFWKMDNISFWQFLSGLFFLIGLFGVIKNIKRIR